MGKKRHSLGSKVRPKKSKKKKVKKSKNKKYLIEPDKLQLGIEDICSQLPDLNLNPAIKDPNNSATHRFLTETCGLADTSFKQSKKKKNKRVKLSKVNENKVKSLLSSRSYEDKLPKKEEKSLCFLLDSLSCSPVKQEKESTTSSTTPHTPGFIYTAQDAKSFRTKLKTRRRRKSSDSDS